MKNIIAVDERRSLAILICKATVYTKINAICSNDAETMIKQTVNHKLKPK